MAGLTTRGLDLMIGSGFAPPFVSLHVGDPGEDGTGEVRGGNPAYERRPAGWTAPTDGTRSVGATVTFDVPQNTTPTHLGYWSARTGGTFYGSRALQTSEHFANQGTLAFPEGAITEALT